MSQVRRRKSNCYCINLRRAANAISGLYDKFLSPIGLSINQMSLLINLNRLESASVSDLAIFVGLERTTLVRTLKPLIDRGLIADIAASGRRNRVLQLTETGKLSLEQGLPLWESAQSEIERRIGKDRISELYEILNMITAE